eukprot:TRINITY_DN4092_c0_g1_i5.p1 TRINITY_DN4092_c0_g1~~TRINITY_DN4092_c0_g1_i5.p1  ORF type:complete len:479 (-),score=125.47 TRINITY_DN4092_c0_g1_i5:43-1326(-)
MRSKTKLSDDAFQRAEIETERIGYRVVDMRKAENCSEFKDADPSIVNSDDADSSLSKSTNFLLLVGKEMEGRSRSVCAEQKDMMFIIRDADTGMCYDLRTDASKSILEKQNEQFTKLPSKSESKPWAELWKDKYKHNKKLLLAAENGDVKAVISLLDPKNYKDSIADVNTRGLEDYTPLHFAASEGHYEVVKILLERDANVDAVSNFLRTPLHAACNRGYTEIIEILLKNKANVNAQDGDGNTPIHLLAEGGWEEGIVMCLKCNPDFNIKNIYGETPREVAASLEVRELLVPLKEYSNQYKEVKKEESTYTRTVVQNVILHNNRADMVKTILFKAQRMNNEHPEEGKAPSKTDTKNEEEKKISARSNARRVKIIEATKKLSCMDVRTESVPANPGREIEESIGLHSFNIVNIPVSYTHLTLPTICSV